MEPFSSVSQVLSDISSPHYSDSTFYSHPMTRQTQKTLVGKSGGGESVRNRWLPSRKREETNLLSLQQIPPTPDKRKESPGKLKLLTTVDWVEFFWVFLSIFKLKEGTKNNLKKFIYLGFAYFSKLIHIIFVVFKDIYQLGWEAWNPKNMIFWKIYKLFLTPSLHLVNYCADFFPWDTKKYSKTSSFWVVPGVPFSLVRI